MVQLGRGASEKRKPSAGRALMAPTAVAAELRAIFG